MHGLGGKAIRDADRTTSGVYKVSGVGERPRYTTVRETGKFYKNGVQRGAPNSGSEMDDIFVKLTSFSHCSVSGSFSYATDLIHS